MPPPISDNEMSTRLTVADFHAVASARDYEWIGTEEQPMAHAKTTWRCSLGHIWLAEYSKIRAGLNCPDCYALNRGESLRKSIEDYRALAAARGFEWLAQELPASCDAKTRWRCPEGHEWKAKFSKIKSGRGCPHCSKHVPKTVADYHALAAQRGFEWLGTETKPRTDLKTSWRCPEGHEWLSRYNSIKRYGCPKCSSLIRGFHRRLTQTDYETVGIERGIKWLGTEIVRNSVNTTWSCLKGHVWQATYNSVHSGSNCPACIDRVNGARVSKQQRLIHTMIGGELNLPVGRYRLDIALVVNGVNIAVEYDCYYWHKGRGLQDSRRDADLLKCGWRTLRIKANDDTPTLEQLDQAVDALVDGANYAEIVLDWG